MGSTASAEVRRKPRLALDLAKLVPAGCAELVAPTRCAGCDLPGALMCEVCARGIRRIDPARACPRCGAPGGVRWCGECAGDTFAFTSVRCAGILDGALARSVRLHKDAFEHRLAPLLAGMLAEALADWRDWPQAVVPVPPSPRALARRGSDHTARLAAELAAVLGVPALDVLRCLPRRDQRGLSREKRIANAAGSIRPIPRVSVPWRVLVIDDVLTTGATLDSASRALRAAGAREVRAGATARACG